MKWEPAEPDDMVELFQYLSDLHRHEIAMCAHCNKVSEEDVHNMLGVWADKCGAWVAKDRFGRVLCMVSLSESIPGTDNVWMFATRAFFDHTGKNLRELRADFDRHIRITGKRYSTLTFSRHPGARKWAKVMGFDQCVEDGHGLRFTRTK